jgi:hypothetical protein
MDRHEGREQPGARYRVPLRDRRDSGGSAFFGGNGKEGSHLLVDVLPVAFGAFDCGFVVLLESKDEFEGLLALFTKVFVAGHGYLQSWCRGGF